MTPRPSGRLHLTTRGQSFALCGVALVVAGLTTGLGDVVRVGALLLVALVAAAVTLLVGQTPLRATRRTSPAMPVAGSTLDIEITLAAERHRSAAATLTEDVPRRMGAVRRLALPSLRPGRSVTLGYRLDAAPRGELVVGPLVAQRTDGLGLSTRQSPVADREVVLVRPRVHRLDGWAVGRGAAGERPRGVGAAGLHGLDDVVVRPYRTGDEPRRINWKASARTGDLMVRQEDRPSRPDAVVLADARSDAHPEAATLEWVVEAAASVVTHLADGGTRTSLVTVDGRPPAPTTASVTDHLDALARLRPGRGDLAAAAAVAATRPAGVVVALLGARTGDAERLRPLERRGSTRLAVVCATSLQAGRAEARVLLSRGWAVTVATPDEPVDQAWARVVVEVSR